MEILVLILVIFILAMAFGYLFEEKFLPVLKEIAASLKDIANSLSEKTENDDNPRKDTFA